MRKMMQKTLQALKKRYEPTEAMIKFFDKRTKEHIERVSKNLHFLITLNLLELNSDELRRRSINHDLSKYRADEKEPYIWLTEFHRCKSEYIPFKYPEGIEKKVDKASLHHIKNNRHHPEFHNSPFDMTNEDLAEMVCDHCAMSQELGNSLIEWENNVINKKWKFSEDQTKLIRKLINLFEKG